MPDSADSLTSPDPDMPPRKPLAVATADSKLKKPLTENQRAAAEHAWPTSSSAPSNPPPPGPGASRRPTRRPSTRSASSTSPASTCTPTPRAPISSPTTTPSASAASSMAYASPSPGTTSPARSSSPWSLRPYASMAMAASPAISLLYPLLARAGTAHRRLSAALTRSAARLPAPPADGSVLGIAAPPAACSLLGSLGFGVRCWGFRSRTPCWYVPAIFNGSYVNNQSRQRLGAFSVLKELVIVLPDCLADNFGSVIPRIEKALNDKSSTSNLKKYWNAS